MIHYVLFGMPIGYCLILVFGILAFLGYWGDKRAEEARKAAKKDAKYQRIAELKERDKQQRIAAYKQSDAYKGK